MVMHSNTESQILEAVRRAPGHPLDDLMASCPNLAWNEIFCAVDVMSRTGDLLVRSLGRGVYSLTLPKKKKATRRQV